MLPYIDIHTHQITNPENTFQVFNYIIEQDEIDSTQICSAGIHPWYIHDDLEKQYFILTETVKLSNVIAIGECGLDKVCNTAWSQQVKAFEQQIHLANEINKPLIIHCVRAFEEVIQTLKHHKNQVPVLFHGLNKKFTLIQSLLNQGYYISLGEFILNGKHDEVIKNIALSKFFLETDNKSTDIVEIYSYFCRVRNIPIEQLQEQLIQNMKNVFNYKIVG